MCAKNEISTAKKLLHVMNDDGNIDPTLFKNGSVEILETGST